MTLQHVVDYALGHEKKEVATKSLEALAKMGHKDLKLNEHESPSHSFDYTGSRRLTRIS